MPSTISQNPAEKEKCQKDFQKFKAHFTECMICAREGADVHHWITRGAGGGDDPDNLVSLCREHHNLVHQLGRETFSVLYLNTINTYRIYNGLERIGDDEE